MSVPNPPDTTPKAEGFAIVPNWLVRDPAITMQAKIVYLVLSSRADRNGACWPSQQRIATEAGMKRTSVQTALRDLTSHGLIEVWVEKTPTGRRNRYLLHVHPWSRGWLATRAMGGPSHEQEEEPVEEEPLKPHSPRVHIAQDDVLSAEHLLGEVGVVE